MNRKKDTYDRLAVGERIRSRRIQLGLSQDELAERIDRAPKYCSDIERGICGMSIETMLSFSNILDMSLDYLMFGKLSQKESEKQKNDEYALIHLLSLCNDRQRSYGLRLLKLFIASMEVPSGISEEQKCIPHTLGQNP